MPTLENAVTLSKAALAYLDSLPNHWERAACIRAVIGPETECQPASFNQCAVARYLSKVLGYAFKVTVSPLRTYIADSNQEVGIEMFDTYRNVVKFICDFDEGKVTV
jgi:hypothetical protein